MQHPRLGCLPAALDHPRSKQAGCRGGRGSTTALLILLAIAPLLRLEPGGLGEIIYAGKGKLFQDNSNIFPTHLVARERTGQHGGEEEGKQGSLPGHSQLFGRQGHRRAEGAKLGYPKRRLQHQVLQTGAAAPQVSGSGDPQRGGFPPCGQHFSHRAGRLVRLPGAGALSSATGW